MSSALPLPAFALYPQGGGDKAACYNVASTRVADAVKVQPLVVAKNEIYAAPRPLPAVVVVVVTPVSAFCLFWLRARPLISRVDRAGKQKPPREASGQAAFARPFTPNL